MANKKISELDPNVSIDGTEEVPLEKAGANFKETFANLKAYIATFANGSNVGVIGPSVVSNPLPLAITHSVFTYTDNNGDRTFQATTFNNGQRFTFLILCFGTSRTLQFGSGFVSQGNLVTGVLANRVYAISFVCTGLGWIETGRTLAMAY